MKGKRYIEWWNHESRRKTHPTIPRANLFGALFLQGSSLCIGGALIIASDLVNMEIPMISKPHQCGFSFFFVLLHSKHFNILPFQKKFFKLFKQTQIKRKKLSWTDFQYPRYSTISFFKSNAKIITHRILPRCKIPNYSIYHTLSNSEK
jgi:hypothetical protein